MATKYLDYSGLSYFWGKIKAWCMKRGTYERIEGSSATHKDLNNYTTAGFYNVKTANVDNCPSGIGVDAVLLVYPWNFGTYCTQELTESAASANSRRWIRKYNQSVWSGWKQVAFSSTTLSGYGITDAKIANGTITLGSNSITPLTSVPNHNQASNTITAMTSYAKANVSSAIATSDSLNTAIGKLEYKIDVLNANSVPPLEVVSLTANTSLTVTDSYTYQKVICINTSGITVTLPTCSDSSARFFIKNNTNSKCYLALASGVTLDGSSDTIDLDPYGYINVIYGGSANTYIIIGGSI